METNEELMHVTEPESVEHGLRDALRDGMMVFGKWLWVYFWVTLATVPVALAAGFEIASESGTIFGTVVLWALMAVLAWALFQAGKLQKQLKVCAWLTLVELAVDVVMILSGSESMKGLWEIPEAVFSMVKNYYLCTGCGYALSGIDDVMSGRWHRLWKYLLVATIGGMIAAPAIAVLALMMENLVLMAATSLISLVFSVLLPALRIVQLIYIFQTAKIFRGIAKRL